MHQGVVGLFAGVEQEVEWPSVFAPLDGFQKRDTGSDVRQRTHKTNKRFWKHLDDLKTNLSAWEIFHLGAVDENKRTFNYCFAVCVHENEDINESLTVCKDQSTRSDVTEGFNGQRDKTREEEIKENDRK